MISLEHVLIHVKDGLAIVTLNRPDKLNAINAQVLSDLDNICEEVESRGEIKTVILNSNGKAFCAGADLVRVKENQSAEWDTTERFIRQWHKVFNRIEDLPVPTIAAIHGYAFAGGLELAMTCDMRIVADTALIGDQHVNFGLLPGAGGTQRLPRLVGAAKAKEIIFTGAWLTGAEAERIGLANKVVPEAELMVAAEEMAAKMLDKSRTTARIIKALINKGLQVDLRSSLEMELWGVSRGLTSDDVQEGLRAFAEKRKPVFTGR